MEEIKIMNESINQSICSIPLAHMYMTTLDIARSGGVKLSESYFINNTSNSFIGIRNKINTNLFDS